MKRLFFLPILFIALLPQVLSAQLVYVCEGNGAYAYHSNPYCYELNNCNGTKKWEYIYDAVNTEHRLPCCVCYPSATNCRNDNANVNYSGADATGMAYAAVGVAAVCIVGSVFILSNDAYCYATHSFYNLPASYEHPILGSSNGWAFGLRKTFDYSAIEYGASFLKYSYRPNNSRFMRYYKTIGYHFNFVHQIFFDKTPDQLRFYIGPTVNYFSKMGYGGVFGAEIMLSDRFKIDGRYELSTQTNQIQFGIIFKYQEEYFWNKRKHKNADT